MNSTNKKIIVKGIEIVTFQKNESDYISLTDMAKFKSYDSGVVISNWLSTKYTIQFMGAWEQVHNPNFILWNSIRLKWKEVSLSGIPTNWSNSTGLKMRSVNRYE